MTVGFKLPSPRQTMNLTATSPLVAPENRLYQEFGRFKLYERVITVVEAYCYRSGQEPGYIKATGDIQIQAPTVVNVSLPFVEEDARATSCAPSSVLEAVEPVPCISFFGLR